MAQYLHSFSEWWIAHPQWVTFIYFCAAILITLFTDRARRVMFAPITYSAKGMLFLMNREMKSRIRVIRHVDKDPFKLIVYIAYYWAGALSRWAGSHFFIGPY